MGVQLLDTDDIDEVNTVLATMDWLSLAGVCQHVSDLGGRNRIVQYASKWLCFGRTRPALERLLTTIDILVFRIQLSSLVSLKDHLPKK